MIPVSSASSGERSSPVQTPPLLSLTTGAGATPAVPVLPARDSVSVARWPLDIVPVSTPELGATAGTAPSASIPVTVIRGVSPTVYASLSSEADIVTALPP